MKNVLILFLACITSNTASSAPNEYLKYQFLSEGKALGIFEIFTTNQPDKQIKEIHASTQMSLNSWHSDWSLISQGYEQYTQDSKLINFETRIQEDDQRYLIKGTFEDKALVGFLIELKPSNESNINNNQFLNLQTFKTTLPKSSELDREIASMYESRFKQKQFDLTSHAFFFDIDQFLPKIPNHNVRLLDTETLQINSYQIEHLGKKQLYIQNKNLPTMLLKLTPAKESAKPNYLWIYQTNQQTLIAKWQGEDDDEPFTLLLDLTASGFFPQ